MTDNSNKLKFNFLGGAGTVTGSKTLIEINGHRVLVDCGLFQGVKELRLKNRAKFPVDPASIDAILITHAHLDHCGYLPILVKQGFNGQIHCTHPTKDLAEIILLDSAKIQEEEAERANRYRYTSHNPAKPLYTIKEAADSMKLFVSHDFHEWVILNNSMKFEFRNNGHILGSAFIDLKIEGKNVVFSGDIGRVTPLILPPSEYPKNADIIILESTYGDRFHSTEDPKEKLHEIIWETYRKNGILMIPTFAVERAQEILFLLSCLKEENRLPGVAIYLDSPMGIKATNVLLKYDDWHHLSNTQCRSIDNIAELIVNSETSKAVVADTRPKIVLAGSGMLSGGRILHYLTEYGNSPKHTLLLTGFQAAGTRGRALLEGAKKLKIFGREYPFEAQLEQLHSLSAHADQEELLNWLSHLAEKPQKIILNHGEPHQSNALRVKLKDKLSCDVVSAQPNEVITIDLNEEELVHSNTEKRHIT